ncbi:hypothetical protein HR12_11065 [Microbacterium sp. SUBG005]|nr:hypothetical protein HR12_11065 [Microbacterium sp. SUBG005]
MIEIRKSLIRSDQRGQRFKTHVALREMRIVFVDVGRIADNHFEHTAFKRGKPAALQNGNIVQPQPFNVAPREGDRIRHHVYRRHGAVRSLAGKRQRNRAGASTEIED